MVFLSAGKYKNVDSWEGSDTEEYPEGDGGRAGGAVNPFVNLVGAVVWRGTILDEWEGLISGRGFTAIGSAGEIKFDSLKEAHSQIEIVGVVSVFKSSLDGGVGAWAFWESVNSSNSSKFADDGSILSDHESGIAKLLILPIAGGYKQQRYYLKNADK